MPQRVQHRQQLVFNGADDTKKTEELGLGQFYRELYLTLDMTIATGAGAAITNANTEGGDEWSYIKNIRIIQNGQDVIRQFTGEQLRWLQLFWYGVPPRAPMAPGLAVSSSLTLSSTLIIPFWSIGTIKRIDTLLDARRLSRLEIEVEFGDVADISSAAGISITGTPQLTVSSLESSGIEGTFSRSAITRILKTGEGVNSAFQERLNVAGEVYTGILINCKDASNVDLVDALNRITLRSGTNEFYNVKADAVQDLTWLRKGIHVTHDDAGGAEDSFFASDDSKKDGWYLVNLITDGFLPEGLDTLGMAELILELDIGTAVQNLTIIPQTYTPIRKKSG